MSPLGGLVRAVDPIDRAEEDCRERVYVAQGGNGPRQSPWSAPKVTGTGHSFDERVARQRAIAEALERHASGVMTEEQLVVATAEELGSEALDLTLVPRCSPGELSHPGSPMSEPTRSAPMRWVRGVELTAGREVYVPAVMAFLNIARTTPAERFWLQVSTGCAAHPDLRSALAGALCEVIERDAVAVTWLQMLPLPRLDPGCVPARTARLLEWKEGHGVETHLFDATSELGVPTVYCLQLAPFARRGAQGVACATALDPAAAAEKAVGEVTLLCETIGQVTRPRPTLESVRGPTDMADYMGLPEHRAAFDFLVDGVEARPLSTPRRLVPGPGDALDLLLGMAVAHGLDVIAVDLTTDEASRAGMSVVRVVIPQLQPMSIWPQAQYRGHPRLYEAPAAMGFPPRKESELNPWPQPFP